MSRHLSEVDFHHQPIHLIPSLPLEASIIDRVFVSLSLREVLPSVHLSLSSPLYLESKLAGEVRLLCYLPIAEEEVPERTSFLPVVVALVCLVWESVALLR